MPAISADGGALVFSNAGTLFVFHIAANDLTALNIRGHHPVWEPSGQRFAYDNYAIGDDGQFINGRTYVFDLTSKTVVDIGEGTNPSWVPDGRTVAVRGVNQIYAVDVKTKMRTDLLPADSMMPVWSPDGHWMIYSRPGQASSIGQALVEPRTIVLRDTRTGAEMSLGDVPGLGNPLDYTWVTNDRVCQFGGGQ